MLQQELKVKIPKKLNLDCYNEDQLARTTIGEQGISDKIDEIIDYLRFLTRRRTHGLLKKRKRIKG